MIGVPAIQDSPVPAVAGIAVLDSHLVNHVSVTFDHPGVGLPVNVTRSSRTPLPSLIAHFVIVGAVATVIVVAVALRGSASVLLYHVSPV